MTSKLKTFTTEKIENFKHGNKLIIDAAKQQGVGGLFKSTIKDLFVGLTWYQLLYLAVLAVTPLAIELISNGKVTDWLSLTAATASIICVVYVQYGRATNYVFGLINAVIYMVLSFNASFYGEVMLTIYFFLMQPIGLWLWLVNALEPKNETVGDVQVKSLTLMGWVKAIVSTIAMWLLMGLAMQQVGSARPFRDSMTNGLNITGQVLMSNLYWEQWIYWILANVVSIYLWWGTNLQMQGMYWVYLVNSIIGMIVWMRNSKKA